MGIDAKTESLYGPDGPTLYDPQGYMGSVLSMAQLENTKCLAFIDPYGDTVFNQLQLPVLIDELKAAVEEISIRKLRSYRRSLVERARETKWASTIVEAYEQEANMGDDQLQSEIKSMKIHIENVLDLLRQAENAEPHTFVRFLGE